MQHWTCPLRARSSCVPVCLEVQIASPSSLAVQVGVTHEILTPAEVQKVHPFLDVSDVVAGIYSRHDGIVREGTARAPLALESRK